MRTCVVDLPANGMRWADSSTKVSSYRMTSKNESMAFIVLLPWKSQTVIYYSAWSLWSRTSVKTSLFQRLTASFGDKKCESLSPARMFLGVQKALQKRTKTATLQENGQSTRQVTSEATCSLIPFANIAGELYAFGLTSQA